MRLDVHPLSQIKAMSVEPLHAGQQTNVITFLRAGKLNDPIEQLAAVSFGSLAVFGNKVVDL